MAEKGVTIADHTLLTVRKLSKNLLDVKFSSKYAKFGLKTKNPLLRIF